MGHAGLSRPLFMSSVKHSPSPLQYTMPIGFALRLSPRLWQRSVDFQSCRLGFGGTSQNVINWMQV